MTHNYNARINYYSFLVGRPKAWELIFLKSVGIKKNDTINVIEVDNAGTPTGNSMTGTVKFTSTNNEFTYATDSTLVYIIPD